MIFANLLLVSEGLDFLKTPPNATYAILGVAVILGLITSLINVKMMNLDEYKRMMLDSKKNQAEMMAAVKSGNQRRIDRAQKKQQELMGQQGKMSMDRMKISLFFFIPFILIWQVLGNFFGNSVIAFFPFDAPYIPRELTVANWYLLCSFGGNIIVSRVLGLTFEIDPDESAVKEDEQE